MNIALGSEQSTSGKYRASDRQALQPALRWRVADIRFERLDRARVCDDEILFFVLASASLIESGSATYTQVMSEHFAADAALVDWLCAHWQHEELQHGIALRTYIAHAWPEFDWQRAYAEFIAEYAQYCTLQQLEQTPALELAARCIVETGTASLYRALHTYSDEPVLRELTANMRSDEVHHYKNFYKYFVAHTAGEHNGRWQILRTLARRLAEIHSEDADCALRHVFRGRYPGVPIDSDLFRSRSAAARALVAKNISEKMWIEMAIKPLYLSARARGYMVPPLASAMKYIFRQA